MRCRARTFRWARSPRSPRRARLANAGATRAPTVGRNSRRPCGRGHCLANPTHHRGISARLPTAVSRCWCGSRRASCRRSARTRESVVIVSDAEKAAEAEDCVSHLPASLVGHHPIDRTHLLVIATVDVRSVHLVAADQVVCFAGLCRVPPGVNCRDKK